MQEKKFLKIKNLNIPEEREKNQDGLRKATHSQIK